MFLFFLLVGLRVYPIFLLWFTQNVHLVSKIKKKKNNSSMRNNGLNELCMHCASIDCSVLFETRWMSWTGDKKIAECLLGVLSYLAYS